MLSNGHAGFGGRSGETHQRKRRQGAPGRPNIAQGKTHKEALRCLKRRISDAVFACLQADARQATATTAAEGPGGQPGNDSDSSAAGSHPERQLFGQATPEPSPTLRPATPATSLKPTSKKPGVTLDTNDKEDSFCAGSSGLSAPARWMQIRSFGAPTRESGWTGTIPSMADQRG